MIFNFCMIFISLLGSSVFSSFETALVTSDPLKIYARVKDRKTLKRMMFLFQNPSQVINSLVVIINIFNIIISVYFFNIFKPFFSLIEAGIIATIFSVFFVLTVGDIIPKIIALYFPRFVITKFYFAVRWVMVLTYPLVRILNWFTKVLFPSLLSSKGGSGGQISRKEVEILVNSNRDDKELKSQQLVEMVYKVLSIDNIRLKEAKIPLNQMVAFPSSMSVKEFKEEVQSNYYSRIPIYQDDIFNISGFVSTQEIFFEAKDEDPLFLYQKKALFFPENNAIDEVIEEMEENNSAIGFVVDEFGAVSGMVTNKDLSQIIMGTLQDERKGGMTPIFKEAGGWIAAGRQDIDELNDRLGLGIKKNGFETLGGFLMFQLKRIPKKEDCFVYKEFSYLVKEMRGFYCSKVKIEPYLGSSVAEDSSSEDTKSEE